MPSLSAFPILAAAAVVSGADVAGIDTDDKARREAPDVAGPSLDRAAFRIFYDRTSPGLRRYLRRISRDPERADDVLQDSYVRLLHRSGLDLDPAKLRAYLYRTATNLLRDGWRREARERRGLDRWLSEWRERFVETPVKPASDLGAALGQLPPRDRAMLWLAHVEGWSHQEIADQFSVRPASVRVLLFRLRRRLADQLRPAGGDA